MSAWALVLVLASFQPEIVVSRLFAATTEGAFVSYSWGEHWTRLRPAMRGLSGELRAFACLGSNVFAGGSDGVFVSDDFGENYRLLEDFEGEDVTTLQAARLFALEPTLFAGTETGLYRSKNAGAEWEQIGAETIRMAVRALAWPGPELFVASDGGLFVSDDAGDSWDRVGKGLPRVPILSIALSQLFGLDPTIFVGTRDAGLYRSSDGGAAFERVDHELLMDKSVEALFWWGELLLIGTEDGLLLSNDGGDTLREVETFRGRAVRTINVPSPEGFSQSDVIVGTDAGVFKSSDGAISFRLMSEGIGTPLVFDLATFPQPPQSFEPPRH
ncbi:MAG: hypothetical protein E2P02_22195 [Acidobacteria bacterium]|nr:MAG: hypothetical protein E2P02_22195 [Acidobacteriota bacterium]